MNATVSFQAPSSVSPAGAISSGRHARDVMAITKSRFLRTKLNPAVGSHDWQTGCEKHIQ